MIHTKLEPKVLDVLKEKVQLIDTDEGAAYNENYLQTKIQRSGHMGEEGTHIND